MISDITTGVQTVTATGAVAGSLNTSAMQGDYSVHCVITALTAGATATIAIQDTASSTPFSDAQTQGTFTITGPIGKPVELSFTKADVGNGQGATSGLAADTAYGTSAPRFGAANTALRANVTALTSGASLSLHAFLQQ